MAKTSAGLESRIASAHKIVFFAAEEAARIGADGTEEDLRAIQAEIHRVGMDLLRGKARGSLLQQSLDLRSGGPGVQDERTRSSRT
jgi:hypothetical protein